MKSPKPYARLFKKLKKEESTLLYCRVSNSQNKKDVVFLPSHLLENLNSKDPYRR
jgi:hypothetical protein